ncbi:hypothetical protein [Paenibacillus terrae]|uniref:Uncharacterized protein n=1 Tax=Paenibacillus terrae TaxID=159743 RepID=A0A0D7X4W7_9BACL|nr:hypothetical protein [Paenibacillus terrae]KJD46460.1 hypothetical protein QD47_06640 [Paenibacillus terrae]
MGNVNRNNISDKFNQYQVFNTSTGEELDGNVIVINPVEDQAALAALITYARVTSNAHSSI